AFVNGDTTAVLGGSPSLSTAADTSSAVAGSPYPITAALGTLNAANYDFAFVNGTLAITPASVLNSVISSANPSPTGSNLTFTATLWAVAPGSGMPSGTVQFKCDGLPLGSPASLGNPGGVGSLTTSALSHGTHTITAEYTGDGNFRGTTNGLGASQVINIPPVPL